MLAASFSVSDGSKRIRWGRVTVIVAASAFLTSATLTQQSTIPKQEQRPIGVSAHRQDRTSTDIFTDVTQEAGIRWKRFNGESPDANLVETKGGAVAFLDFDQDGLLDILLVNGGETPRGPSPTPVRNALYRNLGNGKFEDVAERAGVDRIPFYGIGVAVGDFDNDGFPDLLIAGYSNCALFHNNRDGTYTDVTEKAGLREAGKWSTSAAWFDFDRDGLLDLLICHYAKIPTTKPPQCDFRGTPTYCAPSSYGDGDRGSLYRNKGDGTFADVSTLTGVNKDVGRGLGVVAVDVNDDGWADLFVARDGSRNLLLINQRTAPFRTLLCRRKLPTTRTVLPKPAWA